MSQSLLYLTVDELAELTRAWSELTGRYAALRPLGDASKRPADAVPVNLTLITCRGPIEFDLAQHLPGAARAAALGPLRPTPSGG